MNSAYSEDLAQEHIARQKAGCTSTAYGKTDVFPSFKICNELSHGPHTRAVRAGARPFRALGGIVHFAPPYHKNMTLKRVFFNLNTGNFLHKENNPLFRP